MMLSGSVIMHARVHIEQTPVCEYYKESMNKWVFVRP